MMNHKIKLFNLKNSFIMFFYLIIFFNAIQNNLWKGIYLFLIIILSVLISLFIELVYKKTKIKNFWNELEYIVNELLSLWGLIFLIVFLGFALGSKGLGEIIDSKYLMYISLYYSIMIFILFTVNFLSTSSTALKKNIVTIINAINNFFKNQSILCILFLTSILVFSSISKELFLGLVSSFVFFFLTRVDEYYKQNKINEKEYRKYDIFIQIIINVVLLFILSDFEKLFNSIIYEKSMTYTFFKNIPIHYLIFTIVVLLSHYKEKILSIELYKIS